MPRKRQYTKEDHKRAYEVWHEEKNMVKVGKGIDCTHTTTYRWKDKNFKCPYGCPYHGWEELEAETIRAKQARRKLVEKGEYDPITHEVAMRDAVANSDIDKPSPYKDGKLMMSILTDMERAADAQYIYNKAFYHATGIAREYKFIKDQSTADMEEHYKVGLRPNTLESAWKVMKECMAEVDKYCAINRDEPEVKTKDVSAEISDTGIKELRALKKMLNKITPEELEERSKVIDVAARGRTVEE